MLQLQGKSIFLRPLTLSDVNLLYKWENDKTIRGTSGTERHLTKKAIKEFIKTQKDIYLDSHLRFMICRLPILSLSDSPVQKKKQREVGCIDLFHFDKLNLTAGVGILIDKIYRRQGYASEALSVLIKYSFGILNLRKLFCSIVKDNPASMQLFQKHKFKIVETKKKVCFLELVNI